MATISMCFQLMADEFVAKITWIGEKCGIKKKPPVTEESGEVDEEQAGTTGRISKQTNRPMSALSRGTSFRGSFKAGKGRLIRRQNTNLKRQATNISIRRSSMQKSPAITPKTRISIPSDGKGSVSPAATPHSRERANTSTNA